MSRYTDELITNGDFVAWTADDPDDWEITGEVGNDPEISEVGTGEGHGGVGTGMCNLYTSDGTDVYFRQVFTAIVGRRYRITVEIDTAISGGLRFQEHQAGEWSDEIFTSPGIYSWTYVATIVNPKLAIRRSLVEATDVTLDCISIVEDIPKGLYLSRTGQHFSSFPEN